MKKPTQRRRKLILKDDNDEGEDSEQIESNE